MYIVTANSSGEVFPLPDGRFLCETGNVLHDQDDELSFYEMLSRWAVCDKYSFSVLADSDGGCDREVTVTEYRKPADEEAVFEEGRLIGFALRDKNGSPLHFFLFDRPETHKWKTYSLVENKGYYRISIS